MTKKLVNALRKKLVDEIIEVLKTARLESTLNRCTENNENYRREACFKVEITNNLIWSLDKHYKYPDGVLEILLEKESVTDWLIEGYNKYERMGHPDEMYEFLDYGIIAEALNISYNDAIDVAHNLRDNITTSYFS